MPESNPEPVVRRGPRWLGPLALVAIPIAAIADTLFAQQRGWSADSPMIVHAAFFASALAIALVLLCLLIGPIRRAILARGGQIALLVVGLLIGWVIAEVGLRQVFRLPQFHRRSPDLVLTYSPDPFEMYRVSGEDTRATYNSLGIRGSDPPNDPSVTRVLAIGGSTTECLYLDDTETWPALVEQRLNRDAENSWVGNAGHGDLAIGHHLRFVETEGLPASNDCWLLMVGANDLMRYLLHLDDGHATPPLWYQSNTLSVLQTFWNVRLGNGILWDATGEKLLGVHRRGFPIPPWPEGEPDWEPALETFRQRVEQIAARAKELGVQVVFITQPVLWDDYLSPDAEKRLCIARVEPYPRDWEYLTAANLRTVMDRYNETLELTCRDLDIDLIDAALPMSGQEELFYDDYHLNEVGCAQLADQVGSWLQEHLAAESSN